MNFLNINIGILGHVDSGKTSLAKCLSQVASTAAFDKNPQSQKRGITLDLGFSSFSIPMPKHLTSDKDTIQFTLVDCPGHASLIKTIIGGAQIIDIILLIVDVTKGIQTQTAECLVIGEITNKRLIVVLNKIDLIPAYNREQAISKEKTKINKVLSSTAFGREEIPMVATSVNQDDMSTSLGIQDLINTLADSIMLPKRSSKGEFIFAVDHCFALKGQGTIITGTVLQGCIKVNEMLEIPALSMTKKVKSMQMFKKPVQVAMQGDRLGICVTQFDPKLLERGIICSPGLSNFIQWAIVEIKLIKYFKNPIESKVKFHITIGYERVLAQIILFFREDDPNQKFDFEAEYRYLDNISKETNKHNCFALLQFDKPIHAIKNSLIIGSKLDINIHKNCCRLAFWGYLLEESNTDELTASLKIYKYKEKVGIVDRIVNANNIIVKNMFKKETNLDKFVGMKVALQNGDIGTIESSFGQSGKIKIHFQQGMSLEKEIDLLALKNTKVSLQFKKYLFSDKLAT